MKTLTIYLNSFFSSVLKTIIFILSLYLSALFFLVILLEGTLFGKVNEGRKASIMEFMQKLSSIAEHKEAQPAKVETKSSLS